MYDRLATFVSRHIFYFHGWAIFLLMTMLSRTLVHRVSLATWCNSSGVSEPHRAGRWHTDVGHGPDAQTASLWLFGSEGCGASQFGATRGVTVSISAFLACHQCYCAGSSLAWGLTLGAVARGISYSSSSRIFSGYSGLLPSFIG